MKEKRNYKSIVRGKLHKFVGFDIKKLVFLYINCAVLDEIDMNDYIVDEVAFLFGNDCEIP